MIGLNEQINRTKERLNDDPEYYQAVLSSLKSLGQLLGDSDLNYSVATLPKNDYKKFITFREINPKTVKIMTKRFGAMQKKRKRV